MAAPKIDYFQRVSRILDHSRDLPTDATVPVLHYRRGANDAWNLVLYFERTAAKTNTNPQAYGRTAARLHALAILALVESFEQLFLDELANSCNMRVAERLAEVLTGFYRHDNTLFDPKSRADGLASHIQETVTIAETKGQP